MPPLSLIIVFGGLALCAAALVLWPRVQRGVERRRRGRPGDGDDGINLM